MNRSISKSYLYVNALSELGMRMDLIAMGALILLATGGSALWLSGLLLAGVLGGLLSSLVSGIVADRYERRKIMIISDLLRAGLIAVLIFFPEPWLILLVRFSIGMCSSFFEVSFRAELPEIYGKENMLNINAFVSRLSSIAMVIGFLGGGFLYELLGYKAVFTFDALSFLLSFFFLLRVKWPTRSRASRSQTARLSLRQDVRDVVGYLKLHPVLFTVFFVYVVDTFGSASHNLGIPLLAEGVGAERQALFYGLFWSLWGAGNVISSILIPRLPILRKSLVYTYFLATIGMSLGFILFLSSTSVPWILFFAFVTGVFDAVSVTTYHTLMQQSDNEIRGRIFGVSGFLNRSGFAIGFLVAPHVLEAFTLPIMVTIFHGSIILALLLALGNLRLKANRGSVSL
ncbi:MFS transporter [Tumebacillus lipolyticus]|uniref:MFS transporter n=1 Tax=Tumebacillus lipolyticus TaxID=1280370 RepID=A0ABW5A377_9BACL